MISSLLREYRRFIDHEEITRSDRSSFRLLRKRETLCLPVELKEP